MSGLLTPIQEGFDLWTKTDPLIAPAVTQVGAIADFSTYMSPMTQAGLDFMANPVQAVSPYIPSLPSLGNTPLISVGVPDFGSSIGQTTENIAEDWGNKALLFGGSALLWVGVLYFASKFAGKRGWI